VTTSELMVNSPNANYSVLEDSQRERHSLSMLTISLLEKHRELQINKTSMEEPSGLNSLAKLLVDTSHKVELNPVKSTLFSLVTSVSVLNNGPSKSSSRAAVQSQV